MKLTLTENEKEALLKLLFEQNKHGHPYMGKYRLLNPTSLKEYMEALKSVHAKLSDKPAASARADPAHTGIAGEVLGSDATLERVG